MHYHYQVVTSNTIINALRGCKDELLPRLLFTALFRAMQNHEYFDSEDGAGGYRKWRE
jgi:hypothetical protein